MRSFAQSITDELKKEIFKVILLVEFQFDSTIRYTECDVPLYSAGERYDPAPLTVGNIQTNASMAVDSIELEIANVNLAFSAILLNEDVCNKPVLLSFGCINQDYGIIAAEELFRGIVTQWQLTEQKATIRIANEFILWNKKALRTAQANCRWAFKGDECGYSGAETWCDKSYNRCCELFPGPYLVAWNFGGFRFLPSVMEKEVWWGRTRS